MRYVMAELKISYFPDVDRFINMVANASGNILVKMPNQKYENPKNNHDSISFLTYSAELHNPVRLRMDCTDDYYRFITYMMGCN